MSILHTNDHKLSSEDTEKLTLNSTTRIMVDDKVEMNNDSESYTSANTNDPKDVQELTQYVSFEFEVVPNLKICAVGAEFIANNTRQIPKYV